MTSHSMTFRHDTAFDAAVASFTQFVGRSVRAVIDWADGEREPRNAAELMDWADQFERTEPGYAAELRAVAQRHLRD